MKRVITLLLLSISVCFYSFGQTTAKQLTKSKSKLPRSFCNVGLGVGQNYGMLGIKTVTGYRNSGLLLGVGYVGTLSYEIGAQVSWRALFLNVTYGTIDFVNSLGRSSTIRGASALVGGMISLGKKKRTFIEISGGIAWDGKSNNDHYFVPQYAFGLGAGYRIGNIPEKKTEQ